MLTQKPPSTRKLSHQMPNAGNLPELAASFSRKGPTECTLSQEVKQPHIETLNLKARVGDGTLDKK